MQMFGVKRSTYSALITLLVLNLVFVPTSVKASGFVSALIGTASLGNFVADSKFKQTEVWKTPKVPTYARVRSEQADENLPQTLRTRTDKAKPLIEASVRAVCDKEGTKAFEDSWLKLQGLANSVSEPTASTQEIPGAPTSITRGYSNSCGESACCQAVIQAGMQRIILPLFHRDSSAPNPRTGSCDQDFIQGLESVALSCGLYEKEIVTELSFGLGFTPLNSRRVKSSSCDIRKGDHAVVVHPGCFLAGAQMAMFDLKLEGTGSESYVVLNGSPEKASLASPQNCFALMSEENRYAALKAAAATQAQCHTTFTGTSAAMTTTLTPKDGPFEQPDVPPASTGETRATVARVQ